MRSIISVRNGRIVALFAAALFGASVPAFARQLQREGDVVAVDVKAHTFTIETPDAGGVMEVAFHVGPKSEFFVNGNRTELAGLSKEDHVVVDTTASVAPAAPRVEHAPTANLEITLQGTVVAIDNKTSMVTVKAPMGGGEAEEIVFYVGPSERVYFDGEEVPLRGLRKGDLVTVTYESIVAVQDAKRARKTKTT